MHLVLVCYPHISTDTDLSLPISVQIWTIWKPHAFTLKMAPNNLNKSKGRSCRTWLTVDCLTFSQLRGNEPNLEALMLVVAPTCVSLCSEVSWPYIASLICGKKETIYWKTYYKPHFKCDTILWLGHSSCCESEQILERSDKNTLSCCRTTAFPMV